MSAPDEEDDELSVDAPDEELELDDDDWAKPGGPANISTPSIKPTSATVRA